MTLQRAKRLDTFNSANIEISTDIFGPTVFVKSTVDAKQSGKMHRALLNTGSNVNTISEQIYQLYSLTMLQPEF